MKVVRKKWQERCYGWSDYKESYADTDHVGPCRILYRYCLYGDWNEMSLGILELSTDISDLMYLSICFAKNRVYVFVRVRWSMGTTTVV